MFLLGATAIEDKLQDGVPDTIHTLQMAGIKVCRVIAHSKPPSDNVCIAGLGLDWWQTGNSDKYRNVMSADLRVHELGQVSSNVS